MSMHLVNHLADYIKNGFYICCFIVFMGYLYGHNR